MYVICPNLPTNGQSHGVYLGNLDLEWKLLITELCVSQDLPEKYKDRCMYIQGERDLFQEVGSHDCGGWHAANALGKARGWRLWKNWFRCVWSSLLQTFFFSLGGQWFFCFVFFVCFFYLGFQMTGYFSTTLLEDDELNLKFTILNANDF